MWSIAVRISVAETSHPLSLSHSHTHLLFTHPAHPNQPSQSSSHPNKDGGDEPDTVCVFVLSL